MVFLSSEGFAEDFLPSAFDNEFLSFADPGSLISEALIEIRDSGNIEAELRRIM